MNAITIDHLSKTYSGDRPAVDQVCLTLQPGEVFGFLGPNGAGKTTTIKLLNGILSPTGGSCRIFGIDPIQHPEQAHAMAGVMTEHAKMYENLTGMENLIFYGELFGLTSDEAKKRANGLLRELELSDASVQKLSAYSTGMRQRLSLARALIHRPKILFLDEPTSGLDPESAQNVNRMIHRLARERGVTIFLCTHQLRYAQEICTRYGLIEQGRLFAVGTLDELRAQGNAQIVVQIQAVGVPKNLHCRKTGEQDFTLRVQSEDEIPDIVRRIVAAGGDIYQITAKRPSLEEIYFTLTANQKEVLS